MAYSPNKPAPKLCSSGFWYYLAFDPLAFSLTWRLKFRSPRPIQHQASVKCKGSWCRDPNPPSFIKNDPSLTELETKAGGRDGSFCRGHLGSEANYSRSSFTIQFCDLFVARYIEPRLCVCVTPTASSDHCCSEAELASLILSKL